MKRGIHTLAGAVTELRRHYGAPEGPPTADPFELVLLENVAYLASPEKRRAAFEDLRSKVGTRPADILAAKKGVLEAVTARGILKSTFAEKLRQCARIAIERFGGDLAKALDAPLAEAKKSLQAFPGIGEPGAEKILLFSGKRALLAPESNALRVMGRLGVIREEKSYARTYAAARLAAEELPRTVEGMREAHLLLMRHGQTLCRRANPQCSNCPLATRCAYAARDSRSPV
jgi:endonuclease-3